MLKSLPRKCNICGSLIPFPHTYKTYRSLQKEIPCNSFSIKPKHGSFLGCKNCEDLFVFDDHRNVVAVLERDYKEKVTSELVKEKMQSMT